jgi:hypothetical protein
MGDVLKTDYWIGLAQNIICVRISPIIIVSMRFLGNH